MIRRRPAPEINAGTMADIAFLLLIFFLVSTTMDSQSGISRRLPEWVPDTKKHTKIRERNVLPVLINKYNQLAVRGEATSTENLVEEVKYFFLNKENLPNLPEKKVEEVDFLGKIEISKGVVSLQNDRGTEYGKYIEVQNAIVKAFSQMRDELAVAKFGLKFDQLPDAQQEAVRTAIPLSISEAEPKFIH